MESQLLVDASAEELTPKKDRKEEEKKKKVGSLERPLREKKSVERYASKEPVRVSATKSFEIQQGLGEKLKDIPNVAFKLSKRKADESLRVLHTILFGRKPNVHFLKRNILQFSGFVWSQNEEKDRLKVKEKLNKCNKDRLLDLSDLLDIHTSKVHTKKEDVSARLIEFLESPHVTREVILSEKVKKGKKHKRGVKRTLKEESTDNEKKSVKRVRREPVNDDKEDQVLSIDRNDESTDEDESADAEETSENSNGETEDGEDEQKPELAKKSSDDEVIDEHEVFESKQHSPAVQKVSRGTSKKGSSSSKNKVDNESKSEASSENKTGSISKDTKRNSNMSKTSKKGQSSFKKKVDTEGKSKVNSESKVGILKDTKENSNMSVTPKKGLSSSKKKVDTEGEPKVASEKKTKSSKGSSKMKDEVPKKIDSKDDSKRKVSMKGDVSNKADKKKGRSNVGTASKDMTGKESAKLESNNAEKQGKKSIVPTTEQLYAVVSEILKEVDFNVATLADIIRQLGAHFDTDLMDRKKEIKRILEEVVNNMTDDDDDDAENDDGNGDEQGEKN